MTQDLILSLRPSVDGVVLGRKSAVKTLVVQYRVASEIVVCLSVEVRETRIVINQVSRSGGVITEPVCIHHWLDPPPTRDGSLCNLSWEISQTCQTPFSGKKIRDLLLFISGVSMFVSPSLR